MLLRPSDDSREVGKAEFNDRMRRFLKGEWENLLREAADAGQPRRFKRGTTHDTGSDTLRREQDLKKIKGQNYLDFIGAGTRGRCDTQRTHEHRFATAPALGRHPGRCLDLASGKEYTI